MTRPSQKPLMWVDRGRRNAWDFHFLIFSFIAWCKETLKSGMFLLSKPEDACKSAGREFLEKIIKIE